MQQLLTTQVHVTGISNGNVVAVTVSRQVVQLVSEHFAAAAVAGNNRLLFGHTTAILSLTRDFQKSIRNQPAHSNAFHLQKG